MSMPTCFAASRIVVPSGTVTSIPSMVHVTVGASVLGGTVRAMPGSGSRLWTNLSIPRAR